MARTSRNATPWKIIAAALLLGASGSALAGFDFVFTPNTNAGFGNFTWDVSIEGAPLVANPALRLLRGHTYSLHANTTAIHPLWIKTAPSTGATNAYSPGGTELMGTNGLAGANTLTFTPGAATPDLLYYDCGNHIEMQGVINVPLFADGFE